jgi:hypothetical protein
MVYILGVSSGAFGLVEQKEKPNLMTIVRKIFAGGLEGVNFTQVDLESITEFREPYLEEEVKKIKKLGINFGFHGEFYRGAEKPLSMLDSAIESDYIHSHERLIDHIEGCGKLGGKYINAHPSETVPFIRLGTHLQPSKLVDFWGRPLSDFLRENTKILDWIITEKKPGEKTFLWEFMRESPTSLIEDAEKRIEFYETPKGKEASPEDKKRFHRKAVEYVKKIFLEYISSSSLSHGTEKIAYYVIAKWMQDMGDPLWKSIVGKHIEEEKLPEKHTEWVPAVSAKYIWGHFNPINSKKFKDPKPLLEKYKIYWAFEAEMGGGGIEGMSRFVRPRDMIYLCQTIKSDWVAICIDFEHLLSQNIDIKKEIESIPYGSARYVKLCHLGFPTSLAPAHMPIPLGSKEQLWIYERLFELRKKGMTVAWLIFERAGAPREKSILAMRIIKEFLEKDVPPKELPFEFFGMKPGGPDVKREELAIREHALDPLKGTLAVPEEEYTFLSRTAAEKGKAEEWKKEKYK